MKGGVQQALTLTPASAVESDGSLLRGSTHTKAVIYIAINEDLKTWRIADTAAQIEIQGLLGEHVRGVAPQIPGAPEGDAAALGVVGEDRTRASPPCALGWGSLQRKKKLSAGVILVQGET